jgi:iron complex transport system permease protein
MATVSIPGKEEVREQRGARDRGALTVLMLLLILVALASLTIGSYSLSLHDWWQVLIAPTESGTAGIVLLQVRLPRLLAAMLVGGGLALAGAAYQGLFNNPMVSPDILGASAGAGFGAAVGILFGFTDPALNRWNFPRQSSV